MVLDPDIIVLMTPEIAGFAPVIIGLVAAGGLAAALSIADGLLIAMSSAISHDIYFKMFKQDASQRERLLVARIVILIAAMVTAYFSAINPRVRGGGGGNCVRSRGREPVPAYPLGGSTSR